MSTGERREERGEMRESSQGRERKGRRESGETHYECGKLVEQELIFPNSKICYRKFPGNNH